MNLKILNNRVIVFLPFSEAAGVLVEFFPARKTAAPNPIET